MCLRIVIATILMWTGIVANAQFHVPVFPELEGTALIEAVADAYRPSVVLSYSDARDTLYSKIDARNDTLYCVYTGFGMYLPPGTDPTDAAYQNGNGINAEHTYPRSKGTESTRPKADMNHIFPTRVDVNAARGSFPFAEVPDNQTTSWFYLDQQQSNTPSSGMIDLYSELGNMTFEPVESHKGDVARAMFYVYTVYRPETDAEDPDFFESQRVTLCEWNTADPIDAREFERTYRIADYQGGTQNPFILDCTLATRTYCGDVTPPCIPTADKETELDVSLNLVVSPNPATDMVNLNYQLPLAGTVEVECFNLEGRLLFADSPGFQKAGVHGIPYSLDQYNIANGWLFFRLRVNSPGGQLTDTVAFIYHKA